MVKDGPGPKDADVYVSVRFIRDVDGPEITRAVFTNAAGSFLNSAYSTWSGLNLRILAS